MNAFLGRADFHVKQEERSKMFECRDTKVFIVQEENDQCRVFIRKLLKKSLAKFYASIFFANM
jgi:hypothetical protein